MITDIFSSCRYNPVGADIHPVVAHIHPLSTDTDIRPIVIEILPL